MANNLSPSTSIQKALDIINCFTVKEPSLFLEEIVKKVNIPKTTVFRTLVQLEDYGYINKVTIEGKSSYSLGFAFLEKGQLVKSNLDIRKLAKSEMLEIREKTNLTVQLAIRDHSEAVYIEQFESWRPIRIYPNIGRRAPLYAAACPRVLLAHMDAEEQALLLKGYDFKKFTDATPINQTLILSMLDGIRKDGFSMSKGELFEGTTALAVPIFNPITDEVIASLSIIGMDKDFEHDYEKYIDMLQSAAKSISKKINKDHKE